MKKKVAIFFLTIYMLSATEAHQLLKLPVFFQHFQEHKKEDKGITLLQFYVIHYLHGSPKDKDYDRDMQLPFKTSCDCSSLNTLAIVAIADEIYFENPIQLQEKKKSLLQNQYNLTSYLANIWQPPKSC